MQVHDTSNNLFVVEFDANDESNYLVQVLQDLLAAERIVEVAHLDQTTFLQKLACDEGNGGPSQIGKLVDANTGNGPKPAHHRFNYVLIMFTFPGYVFHEDCLPFAPNIAAGARRMKSIPSSQRCE
jgi:hypothetical protein